MKNIILISISFCLFLFAFYIKRGLGLDINSFWVKNVTFIALIAMSIIPLWFLGFNFKEYLLGVKKEIGNISWLKKERVLRLTTLYIVIGILFSLTIMIYDNLLKNILL
tara:strand:- start:174 stop:500 length:327 start_codon:yes stop_codon:yes gene_type:complete